MSAKIPDCYLCRKRPASQRKSHFTPATATADVFGVRGKEEIYAISPHEGKVDTYFGRDNLKNTDTTVKKDLNTEPYVFCKECEENLSKIEGKVVPLLNKATKDLKEGKVAFKRTAGFQKYFELPIHANIVSTYLYSVVWRQAFQQIYDGQDHIFSDQMYETLRVAVAKLIEMSEVQIAASAVFAGLPNIMCITTIHGEESSDAVNPNGRVSNPELIFMGNYDCLIFTNEENTSGFRKATGLKIKTSEKTLYLNQNDKARIALIPPVDWQEKRKKFYDNEADKMIVSAALKLAAHRNIRPTLAEKMLHEKACQIKSETGKRYGQCFEEAFKVLMS
jgi:hypothetical protein